jgi:hypothetical protein
MYWLNHAGGAAIGDVAALQTALIPMASVASAIDTQFLETWQVGFMDAAMLAAKGKHCDEACSVTALASPTRRAGIGSRSGQHSGRGYDTVRDEFESGQVHQCREQKIRKVFSPPENPGNHASRYRSLMEGSFGCEEVSAVARALAPK